LVPAVCFSIHRKSWSSEMFVNISLIISKINQANHCVFLIVVLVIQFIIRRRQNERVGCADEYHSSKVVTL
jgi:hypothetical protein